MSNVERPINREIVTTYEGIDRKSGAKVTRVIVRYRHCNTAFIYSQTGDGMFYGSQLDVLLVRAEMRRFREQGLVRTSTVSR